MQNIKPKRPQELDPLAAELLKGLAAYPAARQIVLGGYFALKHYCDYRPTHDVDAWWDSAGGERDREAARKALGEVLTGIGRGHGFELVCRRFGDTESCVMSRAGKRVFSFQISARTVQLDPYQPSPWPPLQIETLADNVGSKMNALVQRAAPRDFVDVKHLVASGLVTPAECWHLWARKNPDLDVAAAQVEVARHLQELELRRPLASIADGAERARARATRAWFRDEFLKSVRHAT
jgi:hypothetical protein